MPELCRTDGGAAAHGATIPLGRTTRILRATMGLLMAALVVAGYAGLAALIVPIVVLRSVFGGGGRRQWRVGVPSRATDSLLRQRSVPFPPTTWHQSQGSPTAT